MPELLHTEVEGRPAIVAYFDSDFRMTTPDLASLVKIIFEDTGERRFAVPSPTIAEAEDYNPDQPRVPAGSSEGGEFASSGTGWSGTTSPEAEHKARSEQARKTYNPSDTIKQDYAEMCEAKVAGLVHGQRTPDNSPFDVLVGNWALEVRSFTERKRDELSFKKEGLARKHEYALNHRVDAATVLVDGREDRNHPKIYFRSGVGNFTIKSMIPTTWEGLKELK